MSSFAWPICVCLTVLILGLVILFRHHEAYPSLYGEKGEYTFEMWLSYLRRSTLVTIVDTNVHATVMANEFLKYLIHNTYSMEKRG